MKQTTCVIIPAYNEARAIAATINGVLKTYPLVICVNDGSSDDTARQVAKTKAVLVNHPVNMGQGAALQTGVDFALQFPDIKEFVTFDADGQHSIRDAQKMVGVLKKGRVDVVLGSRFLGKADGISLVKKSMLQVAVRFTNLFSRVKLTDTHNGLRAFNRKFAEQLNITLSGMGLTPRKLLTELAAASGATKKFR